FLAALRALDRFDRRRPFGPWLHRIVVNRAIDWARARALRAEVSADGTLERAAARERPREGDTDARALAGGLRKLSPEHRAAIVAAALSPPGRAVLGSLRKTVAGEKRAAPELFALPSGGRLLVNSPHGPWIVQPNGSRRRLGDYRDAAWSPHGKYVVVARPNEVLAVTPKGDVHWTVPRPRVRFARWGGSFVDTRVAYLSGSRLHMVAGDGTGDVDLCG